MKTLKELFDEHGSVWLALKDRPETRFFKPLGYSEKTKGFLIGEANKDDSSLAVDYKNEVLDYFILYQEPKKKVVRYLFAVRTTQDGWTVRPYFLTDNEAVKNYSKTYIVDFKRLDYTATEFEE